MHEPDKQRHATVHNRLSLCPGRSPLPETFPGLLPLQQLFLKLLRSKAIDLLLFLIDAFFLYLLRVDERASVLRGELLHPLQGPRRDTLADRDSQVDRQISPGNGLFSIIQPHWKKWQGSSGRFS